MTDYLLYLYAESPVRAGAADSLDMLDLYSGRPLPGTPVIWGQSQKGALRQAADDVGSEAGWDERRIERVFGSSIERPGEEGGITPGTLAVGDAQLVAMPVPTLRRTFAWVTSEIALSRLARKYKILHRDAGELPAVAVDAGAAASGDWAQAGRESARAVPGPVAGRSRPGPVGRADHW